MAKTILVDGYNVMLRDGELAARAQEDLARARHALLALISGAGMKARVWFDARPAGSFPLEAPREERVGTALGLFARGASADEALRREVERAGRGATLVTSDSELARWARRRGAVVVDAESFLAELREARGRSRRDGGEPDAGRVDVDDWARWFGFSSEELDD